MVAFTSSPLKAPFPAFGGKSKVAPYVWQRIGDVDNAIEPFANSAAWILARPHAPRIETINDWDCYTANFWRATKHDPETVAEHADNPVNEADLHARHRWLVLSDGAAEFRQRMRTDPEYFDCRIAGWWAWGSCCWIGAGWCNAERVTADGNTSQAIPHIGNSGRGACKALPQLLPKLGQFSGKIVPECSSDPQKGLSEKRPHISDSVGRGCTGEPRPGRPQLTDFGFGRGVNAGTDRTCDARRAWLVEWLSRLRDRLRTVRVCCGDWIRVCDSPSVTTRLGLTGIFLDPPYRTKLEDGKSNRSDGLYASDRDSDVNALVDRVIAYCKERGSDTQMRIAVCGYESEGYEELEPLGWQPYAWKASGGYSNTSGKANDNAARERIWFSPHCLTDRQQTLF